MINLNIVEDILKGWPKSKRFKVVPAKWSDDNNPPTYRREGFAVVNNNYTTLMFCLDEGKAKAYAKELNKRKKKEIQRKVIWGDNE